MIIIFAVHFADPASFSPAGPVSWSTARARADTFVRSSRCCASGQDTNGNSNGYLLVLSQHVFLAVNYRDVLLIRFSGTEVVCFSLKIVFKAHQMRRVNEWENRECRQAQSLIHLCPAAILYHRGWSDNRAIRFALSLHRLQSTPYIFSKPFSIDSRVLIFASFFIFLHLFWSW